MTFQNFSFFLRIFFESMLQIAQCVYSLNTMNNKKSSLLYKFSKHSFFKRCVQFVIYFLNIVININYFLTIITFYYFEHKNFSLNLKTLQIFFYFKSNYFLKTIFSNNDFNKSLIDQNHVFVEFYVVITIRNRDTRNDIVEKNNFQSNDFSIFRNVSTNR